MMSRPTLGPGRSTFPRATILRRRQRHRPSPPTRLHTVDLEVLDQLKRATRPLSGRKLVAARSSLVSRSRSASSAIT
jgi:hypothetical protein